MKPTRGRYALLILVVLLSFGAIFWKLHGMQVTQADTYKAGTEERTQKTLKLWGMRGTIYDSGMIPLAYSKRAYDVQFYRDPSQTSEDEREMYTRSIITLIEIIEQAGKQTITDFWLEVDPETGDSTFNTGTENEAADAKRKSQWRANFTVNSVPEKDLFRQLLINYKVPDNLPLEMKLKVMAIWQESRMNAFKPEPVTIASGVDFETVAEIEVRAQELPGVSIAESSTRVYPKKSLAAHAIGYISKISGEDTLTAYQAKGYPLDAVVGMTGIEYSMEDQLTPYVEYRQGKRVVELNIRGKITRELSHQAPINGNDIVLTLDTKLQDVVEKSLAKNIRYTRGEQNKIMATSQWKNNNRTELLKYGKRDQPVKTAETGAAVAINPNNGNVLALASHPTFDLSIFGSGTVDPQAWREIVQDERNPMYNRAVSTRDTPGSIFKLVTSMAGLMEGAITLQTIINDDGPFTGTDASKQPKCWVSDENRWKHRQDQTLVDALKNSCNYFFYSVGSRLGSGRDSAKLTKWGALLGLTSRTGIELPNESTSFVGNQLMLYDSNRAIDDQYTSKPIFSAAMIKRTLRRVGADRGIEYDEERLNQVCKMLLDLVNNDGDKEAWIPLIRDILLEEMNIPASYIASHFLVNEMYYAISDLRWTGNETIMASIGQSITQVTPVAVSRYVAAIANGGTVFDLHLIDKIVSPTGEIVQQMKPKVVNVITGAEEYINAIKLGMEEVTSVENDGTAANSFKKSKYQIAAKTGTSQRTRVDIENNSWLVSYAPADNPQIVCIVYIQNGYAGAQSAYTAIDTITAYLDGLKKSDSTKIAQANRLAG